MSEPRIAPTRLKFASPGRRVKVQLLIQQVCWGAGVEAKNQCCKLLRGNAGTAVATRRAMRIQEVSLHGHYQEHPSACRAATSVLVSLLSLEISSVFSKGIIHVGK